MADRDDDRNPARHMVKTDSSEGRALFVRQQELFGIVGKDTDRIDALVDHAIKHAPHPIGINGPIAVKRCWSDRQNTGKWILHFDLSVSGHAKR